MEYKEKFEKYLKGELDQAEEEEIRRDIEKLQVLFEHMDQELDQELPDRKEIVNDAAKSRFSGKRKHKDISREISRAVSRKLRNYAVVTGVVVLIIVFLLLAGLSPLLDRVCYNPAKQEEISKDGGYSTSVYQPFQLPLAVYMELFCGDKGFASADIRPEGYGRYMLNVQTQINGKITHHSLELVRNHLYQQDMQWNESDLPGNAFTYYGNENCCSIDPQEAKRVLEQFPDLAGIRAAVSFKDVKNMEELSAFMGRHDAQYLYIPVVSHDYAGFGGYVGFCPKQSGYNLTELYSNEDYPYLDIFEYEKDRTYPAEVMEQHMRSMIDFMMDEENEKFLEIFDALYPGQKAEELYVYKYRNIKNYIEEHGVKGYGAVVYAKKQQLLQLIADETVNGVYILDSSLLLN